LPIIIGTEYNGLGYTHGIDLQLTWRSIHLLSSVIYAALH
jgi:hypothetical protein